MPKSAPFNYKSQITLCDAPRRSVQHQEREWFWARGISSSGKECQNDTLLRKWCLLLKMNKLLFHNIMIKCSKFVPLSKFITMWFLTMKAIYFGGHKKPFIIWKHYDSHNINHQCLTGYGSRWVSGYMVSAWISIQKMH